MGNKNKRGKKSLAAKLMMSTLPNNKSNDNLKDSDVRQTRRSRSNTVSVDPKAVEPKKMATKKTNANITVENLKAMKDEIMEEISNLKGDMKATQTQVQQDSIEILNHVRIGHQELKEKYRNKKNLVASLKLQIGSHLEKCKALEEELNIMTKQYNDSVEMIDLGNRTKIEEISAVQKNVLDLTETIKGLKAELEKKDEEQKNFVDSLKKNHEVEILKCQESVKSFVSKEEYNRLVDEYDLLKRAFEESEQKLTKTLADKRAVEKSKLQVIRQKAQVKNELMDFVINVNKKLKPTTQFDDPPYDRSYDHPSDQSYDRSTNRSTDQSCDRSSDRFTDRSYNSLDFDKGNSKFKRPGPSSANLFTNKRFKRL